MCQYMLLPKVLAKSKHFEPTAHVQDLAEYASPIVSCGNQTGEGWFLTGEMLELINEGVTNIICAQPFACLPNHIVGKGVMTQFCRKSDGCLCRKILGSNRTGQSDKCQKDQHPTHF